MSTARSLHIKCANWDQVQSFTDRKLRRGNLLSMKVPFAPDVGDPITLGLELPNEVVVAIDGVITKTSDIEGTAKTWVELELTGLTTEILVRLRAMVADGRDAPKARRPAAAAHSGDELAADERGLFVQMSTELKRLRALPVHGVLGVSSDADAAEVRRGWLAMVRRFHPDGLATQGSVAISHLAEEILIHVNRSYDRLRRDLVAAGRAAAVGSALIAPRGWLVGFDEALGIERRRSASASIRILGGAVDDVVDVSSDRIVASPDGVRPPWRSSSFDDGMDALSTAPVDDEAADDADDLTDHVSIDGDDHEVAAPNDNLAVLDGGSYEARARSLLAIGDNDAAQELLAAALVSYPRSRTLRSLYYVAGALVAIDGNQRMLATSQLEAALAQADGDGRGVAAAILEQLANHAAPDLAAIKRLFS